MPIVGFDQDPEAVPGAGTFHFDDGSSMPAYSPDDAAPFLAPPAEPDQRIASTNPADVYSSPAWQAAAGGAPQEAPAGASDVGPQMSPAPDATYSAAPPADAAPPPYSSAPAGAAATAPQPEAPPTPSPIAAPQALSSRPQARPDASLGGPLGPAPKGMQAASMTRSFSDAGRPGSPEEADARANLSINQALVEQAHAARVSLESAQHAEQLGQAADQARERVAQQQAQRDQIRQTFRAKRQAIQADVDKAAQQKVDPNKYWEDRGALGTILIGIGQVLGAYGATLGHTENYAQKMIDQAINNDIAAQRENIARNGANAQNKLSALMNDYDLDVSEATDILRNSQQQLADTHALQLAEQTKSKDVIDSYQRWFADRQLQREATEREIADRAYGKAVGSVTYKPQQAGGQGMAGYGKLAGELGYGSAQHMIQDYAAKRAANPDISWGEFVSQGRQAMTGKLGPGGGQPAKVSARLQGMLVKDETIHDTAQTLGETYGLERGKDGKWQAPGYLTGKAKAVGYAAGGALGTADSRSREAIKETLVDEMASAAAQGKPDAETMAVYRKRLSSNDPNAIAQILNEAERAGARQKAAVYEVAKQAQAGGHDDDEEPEK